MKLPRLLYLIMSIAFAGLLFSTHAYSELQRNPFENKSEALNKNLAEVKKAVRKRFPPRITSVIVAGSDSLIKSGDRYYRVGEIVDDYILTEVYENGALFVMDGKTINVKIIDNEIQ